MYFKRISSFLDFIKKMKGMKEQKDRQLKGPKSIDSLANM